MDVIVADKIDKLGERVEYYGGGHIKPRRGYSKQCDDAARQGLREVGAEGKRCINYSKEQDCENNYRPD